MKRYCIRDMGFRGHDMDAEAMKTWIAGLQAGIRQRAFVEEVTYSNPVPIEEWLAAQDTEGKVSPC